MPRSGSPDLLTRIALRRRLEARIVTTKAEFEPHSAVEGLSITDNWTSSALEQAITEIKAVLEREAEH
jgi:hypothetical protein